MKKLLTNLIKVIIAVTQPPRLLYDAKLGRLFYVLMVSIMPTLPHQKQYFTAQKPAAMGINIPNNANTAKKFIFPIIKVIIAITQQLTQPPRLSTMRNLGGFFMPKWEA